jgi:MYXO-CTERM domain-containing protein
MAAPTNSVKLPFGVHETRAGRYLQDMCPVTPGTERRPHCLGKWLLPEDWKPGMALPDRSPVPHPGHGGTTCTGALQGMGPTDITTAYKLPSAGSGGKIVAVVDLEDATAAADIAGYRSVAGITAIANCTTLPTGSGTPCFAQVDSETGAIITSPVSVSTDADGETALDMAMVSAACPDCSVIVVGISTANASTNPVATADTGWQAFVDGVATAKRLGASAVSISFGSFENTDPNVAADGAEAEDSGVTLLDPSGVWTQSGMPVFVAAGDFAYLNENNEIDAGLVGASPSFPASAPDVIAVGGTMLIKGTSSYTEAVWDDGTFGTGSNGQDVTTSGCSTEFTMPPWQSTALSGSGCAMRATADVAAAAAYAANGASAGIGLCGDGQVGAAEGTSAASPMMAAIFTRIGATTGLSANLGQVYTNASGFNDLGSSTYPADTTGNLGSTTDAQNCPAGSTKLCTVGTGWDGPSGVGTPNATALAALTWNTPLPNPDAGSGTSSGTASSSSGSSSGTTSGTTSGTSNGSSNGSGTQEDSGASSSSGGNFGSSGSGSSGCAVVSGSDGSNVGLFAGMVGIFALLGVRRRKHAKK